MSLILDLSTEHGSARHSASLTLEHNLTLPLDDAERARVEDEQWGLTPDAIAEAERINATLFGGQT